VIVRTSHLIRIASIVVFILSAGSLKAQAQAVSAELRSKFEQLIGTDPVTRAAAYDSIAKTKDGSLAPPLEAYRNALLERRTDNSLVIYLPRQEIAGRKVFPVVDAWTLQPIKKPDGSPEYDESLGRNMLKPEDADREKLGELIAVLSIFHPDPQRRRQAIVEAATRADAPLLDDLRGQLRGQPAGELAIVLRESIARIELVKGTGAARLEAVRTLGDLGTAQSMAALRAELDKSKRENNPELANEIERALQKVSRYQLLVRLLQNTFAGLSLGSILVLLALGLSIIFGLMRVINLAHGEFMMVGAYTTYLVCEFFKAYMPARMFDYFFICALPLAFLVAGFVGWLCEVAVIQHLYGRPIETLLATWGISLLLIQTARLLFGDTTSLTPPSWFQGGWTVAPDLVFPLNRVFIIVFCAFCVAIVYYLVHGTRFGLLLRATTQDRPIASACGVRTRWIDGLTFAFGAGLAGLAGAIVPLFDKLNPNMGQGYVVDSFMVVVVGGVGKLAGAITAGSALGFLTKYIEPWLEAVYGKLAVLGLIIVFLQWRPSGLFPHRGRLAED
jgi:urea transport system permease protein